MIGAFLENTTDCGIGFYIREKSKYNDVYTSTGIPGRHVNGETRMKVIRKNKEDEAERMFKNLLKIVKNRLKKCIKTYEPLQFKTAYGDFLKRLRLEDYSLFRKIPGGETVDAYLSGKVKDFLCETAYFMLYESFVKKRVMARLEIFDTRDIRVIEMVDFVSERIEAGNLKRLKAFKEQCSFKTYLATVVTNLINDFWRVHSRVKNVVTKYSPEFEALFDSPADSPLTLLLKLDNETLIARCTDLLPGILSALDSGERLAIKLKYRENMKLSEIARELELNRYKTKLLINRAESAIKIKLQAAINTRDYKDGSDGAGNGGNDES